MKQSKAMQSLINDINKLKEYNEKSKTFCFLPFSHVQISGKGNLKPCCNARWPLDKKDAYSLNYNKFEEYWNSDYLKQIRLDMLNGKKHPACSLCYKEEDKGIESMRIENSKLYTDSEKYNMDDDRDVSRVSFAPEMVKRLDRASEYNGEVQQLPTGIDIKFSNLCNLKCRMCNPSSSSQIHKEIANNKSKYAFPKWMLNDYKSVSTWESKFKKRKSNIWYETDSFKELIGNRVNEITHIKTTGGEPVLIDALKNFMKNAVETGESKHIVMHMISNGLKIDDEILGYLKQFQVCNLAVSVDGYGSVYDYIRTPGRWSNLEKNLLILRDSQSPYFDFEIDITVQILNVLNIIDLVRWSDSNNIRYKFQYVEHPSYYNICCLPDSIKNLAIRKIKNYISEGNKSLSENQLETLLNVIKSKASNSDESFIEFKKFNSTYDNIRNQELKEYVPDLYKLL